jgi:hypothetical protein
MKQAFVVIVTALALSISSTAFAEDKYNISAPAVSAKKGVKTTAFVTLTGAGQYQMNIDYPLKVILTAPSGVQLEKTVLARADATEWRKEGVKLPIVFTATQAGTKVITGEAKFAVMTATDAVPQTVKLQITVTVN